MRNHALLHLFDGRTHFGNAGQNGRVRGDRGIQQDRLPLGCDDVALIVKGHRQFAKIFGIGIGLHHGHITDHGRVGARCPVRAVRKQRMRMPAHDHVDARHRFGNCDVHGQTNMGQRDDLVHTLSFERGDIGLQRFDLILKDDVIAGGGCVHRIGCQSGNDANLLAADLKHHVVFHLAHQRRFVFDVEVARNHRKGHRVNKGRQASRTIVELVVADGHDVIADVFHELSLGSPFIGGVEQ